MCACESWNEFVWAVKRLNWKQLKVKSKKVIKLRTSSVCENELSIFVRHMELEHLSVVKLGDHMPDLWLKTTDSLFLYFLLFDYNGVSTKAFAIAALFSVDAVLLPDDDDDVGVFLSVLCVLQI